MDEMSFEEAEADLEDKGTEIEEVEMSHEGTKFASLPRSFYQNIVYVYNNFTTKLLSKLLSDLSVGVQIKNMCFLILRSLIVK